MCLWLLVSWFSKKHRAAPRLRAMRSVGPKLQTNFQPPLRTGGHHVAGFSPSWDQSPALKTGRATGLCTNHTKSPLLLRGSLSPRKSLHGQRPSSLSGLLPSIRASPIPRDSSDGLQLRDSHTRAGTCPRVHRSSWVPGAAAQSYERLGDEHPGRSGVLINTEHTEQYPTALH